MSSDIRSSPTCLERAAASCRLGRFPAVAAADDVQVERRSDCQWCPPAVVLARPFVLEQSIRPFVLTCQAMSTSHRDRDRAPAQTAQRRRAQPRRDPPGGGAARDGRGHRRALDRPPRRAVGMSKSGLFAHFGSKEELQLATIETRDRVFTEHVLDPAAAHRPGCERLRRWRGLPPLRRGGVFPGGCFFASVAGRGRHAARARCATRVRRSAAGSACSSRRSARRRRTARSPPTSRPGAARVRARGAALLLEPAVRRAAQRRADRSRVRTALKARIAAAEPR